MRRAKLHLEAWTPRLHTRAGFWQIVVASLAVVPLVWAAWLRVGPAPRAPETPADTAPGEASAYFTPLRETPTPAAMDAIASGNLFAPTRTDWAEQAVAEAGGVDAEQAPGARQRQAALQEAEAELDKLEFRAVMRVGDDWTALFDSIERAPFDDLISLHEGDAYKSWTVLGISRDSIRMGFEGDERSLDLRPRTDKPGSKKATQVRTGRSRVVVRPAEGVRVEPPITIDEAERRLRDTLKDDDAETLRRLDNLLKDLRDGNNQI